MCHKEMYVRKKWRGGGGSRFRIGKCSEIREWEGIISAIIPVLAVVDNVRFYMQNTGSWMPIDMTDRKFNMSDICADYKNIIRPDEPSQQLRSCAQIYRGARVIWRHQTMCLDIDAHAMCLDIEAPRYVLRYIEAPSHVLRYRGATLCA